MIVETVIRDTGFPLIHRHIAHPSFFWWAIIVTFDAVANSVGRGGALFVRYAKKLHYYTSFGNNLFYKKSIVTL